MPSYTHFVFDFDGVLCDSLPLAMRTHNKVREVFSEIPPIATRAEWNNIYNCAEPLAAWLDPPTSRQFFSLVVEDTLRNIGQLRLVEEYQEIVTSVGSSPMYILTAGSEHVVQTVLGVQRPRFRDIRGRESAHSKHDGLAALLTAVGCDRCDVLYIGDTPGDIHMCKGTGVDVIGVGSGYGNPDDVMAAAPTFYAGSLTELAVVLRRVVRNENTGASC